MRVTNLTVAFDSRVVLRGVSAAFAEGTFTVVLGPNGVGKTTLLRAMVGARGATSGEVELCGRPLGAYGGRERAARLAYVPQRSVVEFGFTVAEVVGLGRYGQAGVEEGVVEGAMRAVGMEALVTVKAVCSRPFRSKRRRSGSKETTAFLISLE